MKSIDKNQPVRVQFREPIDLRPSYKTTREARLIVHVEAMGAEQDGDLLELQRIQAAYTADGTNIASQLELLRRDVVVNTKDVSVIEPT